VRDVTPNDATASVIHAPKGVKPEDKVRAIFEAPGVDDGGSGRLQDVESGRVGGSRSKSHRMSSSHGKLLLTILAVVGLASLFKSGHGTERVGAVTARAGFAPELTAANGGIRIAWDPGQLAQGRNVVEYHIWRDNGTTPVAAPLPALAFFDDDVGTGQRAAPYYSVDPLTNTRTAVSSNLVDRPEVGVPHQYWVSAVYQVLPANSTTAKYYETPREPTTGMATIIRKLLLADLTQPVSGDNEVNPAAGIRFEFKSRRGADTYIIQIATTPNFSSGVIESDVISYSGSIDDANISTIVPSSRTGVLSAVSSETPVYWRVGARNSLDNPGPVLAGGKSYLFSDPSIFYVQLSPPPPP